MLHSGYSNIRLESYLFTKQAMDDVRKRLAARRHVRHVQLFSPGLDRVAAAELRARRFGNEALVLNLPSRDRLNPDDNLGGDFTMLIAGDNRAIRDAFARQPEYWLRLRGPFDHDTMNGFETSAAGPAGRLASDARAERDKSEWRQFRLTQVNSGAADTRLATDDWPMLYLREPMIPGVSLRGGAIMAVIAALMLASAFARKAQASYGGTRRSGHRRRAVKPQGRIGPDVLPRRRLHAGRDQGRRAHGAAYLAAPGSSTRS